MDTAGFNKTLFTKTRSGSRGRSLPTPALVCTVLGLQVAKLFFFRIRHLINYKSVAFFSQIESFKVQPGSLATVHCQPPGQRSGLLPAALLARQMGQLPGWEAQGKSSAGLGQRHCDIIYPHVNSVYKVTPKGLVSVCTCICQTISGSSLQPARLQVREAK